MEAKYAKQHLYIKTKINMLMKNAEKAKFEISQSSYFLKDIKYRQKFALPFKISSEVPKLFV